MNGGALRPPSAADIFPEHVQYPTHCGSICQELLGNKLSDVHAKILEAFMIVAQRYKTPQKVAQKDLLLVLEASAHSVEHPEEGAYMFAFMPSVSFRARNVEPTQTFTMLKAESPVVNVGDGAFAGLALRLAYRRKRGSGVGAPPRPSTTRPVGSCT